MLSEELVPVLRLEADAFRIRRQRHDVVYSFNRNKCEDNIYALLNSLFLQMKTNIHHLQILISPRMKIINTAVLSPLLINKKIVHFSTQSMFMGFT
jgi:hypothetical protein